MTTRISRFFLILNLVFLVSCGGGGEENSVALLSFTADSPVQSTIQCTATIANYSNKQEIIGYDIYFDLSGDFELVFGGGRAVLNPGEIFNKVVYSEGMSSGYTPGDYRAKIILFLETDGNRVKLNEITDGFSIRDVSLEPVYINYLVLENQQLFVMSLKASIVSDSEFDNLVSCKYSLYYNGNFYSGYRHEGVVPAHGELIDYYTIGGDLPPGNYESVLDLMEPSLENKILESRSVQFVIE